MYIRCQLFVGTLLYQSNRFFNKTCEKISYLMFYKICKTPKIPFITELILLQKAIISNERNFIDFSKVTLLQNMYAIKQIFPFYFLPWFLSFQNNFLLTSAQLTYLLTYLPTYLYLYLPTYLLTYLHTYIHTYLLILTYILTYLHTYLLTYLLTYTYLFTYLLTLQIRCVKLCTIWTTQLGVWFI